jgi:hypothetical protein
MGPNKNTKSDADRKKLMFEDWVLGCSKVIAYGDEKNQKRSEGKISQWIFKVGWNHTTFAAMNQ